jgi:thioredoxin 1|tara:strand:+ start:2403 stop:2732 length:330 start_codon:yes stop_codon:yes gene_type:complete
MTNNLVEITDDNFDTEVLESELPVLVDFWAEWCGPCKMISPIVEEIASDYNGKVKVGKVNIDYNQQVAMTYGIRGIPALLVFKSGSVANQIVGAVPKNHITQILDEVIN